MIPLRKFGLNVIGDVPWGTHLCLFYETKDDLAEILVPYFAEGLRSNEACAWVTSEPLEHDEAFAALAHVIPDLDHFIQRGQLLVLPYTEVHMKDGTFDPDRVMQFWVAKEQEALDRGFEGLRLAGNTFWIQRELWDTFTDYEEAVDAVIGEHRMIAVCPYSLERCVGTDVVEVVRNHVGTIIKQGASWSVVEDATYRRGAEEAAKVQARHAQTLSRIIISGNQAADLHTACAAMLDAAMELMQVTHGSIYLLNEQDGMIELKYARGFSQAVLDASNRFPLTTAFYPQVYAGTPMFLNDYQSQGTEEFRVLLHDLPIVAVVPLIAENRVIGNYVVGRTHAYPITSEEQALLTSIGQQAGTVIARLQAEAAAKENARQQSILTRVITAGNQAPDVRTACSFTLEAAMEFMDVSHGSIYLLNEEEGMIERQYARGYSQAVLDASDRFSLTTSFYPQIYAGKAMFLNDYQKQGTENLRVLAPELRVVAVVPLVAEHRVIGNYMVGSTRTVPFTAEEETLLIAIGEQAGTVIARLHAEEDLSESEARYRSLVERNFDGVIIHSEGVIRYANDAAARIAKASSPHELIGRSAFEISTPEYRALMKQRVQEIYRTRKSSDLIEIQMNALDGTIVDIELSGALMTYEGKPAIYVVARDISERKRMEAQLKQYADHLEDLVEERTARLKDSERLAGIGETAAMIGHDLRNPLQAMQYMVDLQKARSSHLSLEMRASHEWQEVEALNGKMSEQIYYMDKIVSDLQDYARPVTPEREEIALKTLILDVIPSLPLVDGVEIVINVHDLVVNVDPYLMHRVFSNLILNSIQAMPDGGTLTISAEASGGAVTVNVSDTGIGIPVEMRNKIFSPLTTGKAKGTGLGLAVVKRIVDAHNGTITFESEEGKGTTFAMTLPTLPLL